MSRQVKMTGRRFRCSTSPFSSSRNRNAIPSDLRLKKRTRKASRCSPVFVRTGRHLWLSEDEAVAHVLSRHFTTFGIRRRKWPPNLKGVYTFASQWLKRRSIGVRRTITTTRISASCTRNGFRECLSKF